MIHRTLLRVRRFVALELTRLRRGPEVLAIVAAGLLVVVVIRATTEGANWAEILRGQAVNLLSAGLIAGFAYVMFVLRFRRGQLSTYLDRQRAAALVEADADPELDALARTIVDELLDAKPPHAVLIIGTADPGQAELLAGVAERLARKRRVPVAVRLPTTDAAAGLPGLVRDRFVEGLVGSSGDAQSGRRLFASLVRRRRVVALVRGLDRVGQGEALPTRRGTIAHLLEASLVEGIPFVAWVTPDLAPSISEVAAFRTRPLPQSELVAYTMRQLRDRGLPATGDVERVVGSAFRSGEATREPVLLALFADLVRRRVRGGATTEDAASELLSDGCSFRRHVSWMCEWALDCSLDDLEKVSSPASLALAALGREAHYRQEAELDAEDVTTALDTLERRRFAAGIALLAQRGVLDVSPVEGGSRIRFAHPTWLAFAGAVGLRLDEVQWRDLLRADISSSTLDALTGALLTFGSDALRERSFLRVLRGLGVSVEISLEMCLSVITALQSRREAIELGGEEMGTLERAWSTASDVVKTRFASDVDLVRNTQLVDFLWRRVVPPGFDENSFRVRRVVCDRLGHTGAGTWARLGGQWRALVAAAGAGDLSSRGRQQEHWRDHGYAVASLGWTLPGVLHTVGEEGRDDVLDLLGALRQLVSPGSVAGDRRPEIGLEISLAEGFKIAAAEIWSRGETCDGRWYAEAAEFLDASTSWISKQALLQSLALVLDDVPDDRLDRLLGAGEGAEREHPFVRETAALIRRALAAGKGPARLTQRDVWLEDVEALDDGGVNLSAEAHRLLALSTLLINLAEWPFVAWIHGKDGASESSVDARDRAFTGIELPRCFLRSGHAATMFETACDCPFRFCGPDAKSGVLHDARRVSRSFLQRAQATASAPSLIRREGKGAFAERAFGPVWRELDDELAKEEPYLGSP
ncbi:MAG: hypothetical protein M3273_05410 [Actinomycetota bacterium]|nr:hypothetical protein [Actinomycetota bacterium]